MGGAPQDHEGSSRRPHGADVDALRAITGDEPTRSFVDLPMLTLVAPPLGPPFLLIFEPSSGSNTFSPKTAGGHAAGAMALATSGNVARLLLGRDPLLFSESPLSMLVGEGRGAAAQRLANKLGEDWQSPAQLGGARPPSLSLHSACVCVAACSIWHIQRSWAAACVVVD